AMNFAMHREDFIQYATRGNGEIIPALLPAQAFGYDPTLLPYPFDPTKARQLLREAGYPEGLAITLLASEDLVIQATVVSKMLEQAGLQVALPVVDSDTFNRKTYLSHLEQPSDQQTW